VMYMGMYILEVQGKYASETLSNHYIPLLWVAPPSPSNIGPITRDWLAGDGAPSGVHTDNSISAAASTCVSVLPMVGGLRRRLSHYDRVHGKQTRHHKIFRTSVTWGSGWEDLANCDDTMSLELSDFRRRPMRLTTPDSMQ